MPTLKEAVWAILAIAFASAIVMIAVAQLDSSAWAEGMRAEALAATQLGENQVSENQAMGEGIPAPLMMVAVTVGSLLKITLLMGLPGLITIGVLRLKRRYGKRFLLFQ